MQTLGQMSTLMQNPDSPGGSVSPQNIRSAASQQLQARLSMRLPWFRGTDSNATGTRLTGLSKNMLLPRPLRKQGEQVLTMLTPPERWEQIEPCVAVPIEPPVNGDPLWGRAGERSAREDNQNGA